MAGNENVVMYTDFFKLSEPPFSLTPDPRFLYMSERHREGLAHLFYGVQQPGGFVQLTGDIGSGKTTLCRCLIKQLPPGTDIALILNPRLTVIELLATVCDELGISYPAEAASNKVLIDALNQRLLESHARSRRTVLIIDEAQNLNEDVLEQIRLLTNLETSKEKLLQIILIGQPELLSLLKRKNLRQLAQRITARYHLLSLSRSETHAYIQHRLLVAGRKEPLFTRRAMHCVYRLSRGMPRVINIICDRALLGAYALDAQRVSAGIVRKASRETRGSLAWLERIPLCLGCRSPGNRGIDPGSCNIFCACKSIRRPPEDRNFWETGESTLRKRIQTGSCNRRGHLTASSSVKDRAARPDSMCFWPEHPRAAKAISATLIYMTNGESSWRQ